MKIGDKVRISRDGEATKEFVESDFGILNDDERVDLKWLNVEETEWD